MSVNDVLGATAKALTDAARSGQGMRVSAKGLSYGLTGYYSLAGRLTHLYTEGQNYAGLVVKDSATPVGKVAEGSPKPKAATTSTESVKLSKHAGYAEVTLESLVFFDEAVRVVRDVLWRQALQSLDAEIVATLATDCTPLTSAATALSDRIIDAIAQMLGKGARSSVIALNPVDFAALITANDGGQYLNMNDPERGPSGLFMSHQLVPINALAAGTVYVIDPSAVVVAEASDSPFLFVSPMNTENKSPVILDLFASPLVVLPEGVGKLATTKTTTNP